LIFNLSILTFTYFFKHWNNPKQKGLQAQGLNNTASKHYLKKRKNIRNVKAGPLGIRNKGAGPESANLFSPK